MIFYDKFNTVYFNWSILLKTIILFLFFTNFNYAQFEKMDSIGNFYISKNKLIWQKFYPLEDMNKLNKQLKSNALTNNLNILNYQTSAISELVVISGQNLPQYAQQEFNAFVIVDVIDDRYRVTIKDITFHNFVTVKNYNGIKNNSGGTLDYYILKNGASLKRNSSTYNVLKSFDKSFMDIFRYSDYENGF